MPKGVGSTIAQNKKAGHDYFIEDTFEAGLVLQGTEIKSIRAGKVNLRDSFVRIERNEAFVHNMHISHYEQGNRFNHDPLRTRKLLLHKEQIGRLAGLVSREGYTLVPLSLYLKNGRVKVALGICKGKKNYDKRDSMLEKAHKRDIERQMKERNRY